MTTTCQQKDSSSGSVLRGRALRLIHQNSHDKVQTAAPARLDPMCTDAELKNYPLIPSKSSGLNFFRLLIELGEKSGLTLAVSVGMNGESPGLQQNCAPGDKRITVDAPVTLPCFAGRLLREPATRRI